MCRSVLSALAYMIFPAVMFAQSDAFQIRFAANLPLGDSVVDVTNAGTTGSTVCVNVYTFDATEELVSCCTCPVTPNGLNSLSVKHDLINNTLTPAVPNSVVIKLLASAGVSGVCNAASPGTLVSGLRAWGTTIHTLPSGAPALTESPFLDATLSSSEFTRMTTFCGFIQEIGSGHGICNSCRTGGLLSPSISQANK